MRTKFRIVVPGGRCREATVYDPETKLAIRDIVALTLTLRPEGYVQARLQFKDGAIVNAEVHDDLRLTALRTDEQSSITPEELALSMVRRRLENAIAGVCYVCGCTEDNACVPTCGWADTDLCSAPNCIALDDAIRGEAREKV